MQKRLGVKERRENGRKRLTANESVYMLKPDKDSIGDGARRSFETEAIVWLPTNTHNAKVYRMHVGAPATLERRVERASGTVKHT